MISLMWGICSSQIHRDRNRMVCQGLGQEENDKLAFYRYRVSAWRDENSGDGW